MHIGYKILHCLVWEISIDSLEILLMFDKQEKKHCIDNYLINASPQLINYEHRKYEPRMIDLLHVQNLTKVPYG